MKKLTRKLFISILAAVFAVVALGTSTFAWITISNSANVEAFDGTVEAGKSGIELSLDGATYSSTLASADINKAITDGGFKAFTDLTSLDGEKFDKIVIAKGSAASNSFEGKTRAGETAEKAVTEGVLEFTFHVILTNPTATPNGKAKQEIYLDLSALTMTSNNDGTFTPDYADAQPVDGIKVSNAARIAVNCGQVKEIIEQKEDSVTEHNTTGFDKTGNGFAYKYLIKKGYSAYDSTGKTEPVANGELPDISGVLATIHTNATKKAGDTTDIKLAELDSKTPDTTVTIRIWVEGWDNECHANILGQKLSVAFKLYAKEVNLQA